MQEGDPFPLGTDARDLIDQLDPSGATTLQRDVEVIDGEAHVVNARPFLLDEARDRRRGVFTFQQLDQRFAGHEAGYARSVAVVELDLFKAQDIPIEWSTVGEGSDGDSDVGNSRSARGCWGH